MGERRKTLGYNWVESILLGLLLLFGLDVLIGLSIAFMLNISDFGYYLPFDLEHSLEEGSVPVNFVFYTISRVGALLLLLNFLRRRSVSLRSIGFRSFNYKTSAKVILLSVFIFFVLVALAFFVVHLIYPEANLDQEQDIFFRYATDRHELLLAFISVALIAPVAEETIFRGFMLPVLKKRFGIVLAILITSLLFGLIHVQLNIVVMTFVLGLLLGWIVYKTSSIWPAILFHSLKNSVAFLLIFYR
jgi:uncharacterized protein